MEITELTKIDLTAYRSFLNQGLVSDEESFRITVQDDDKAPFPTAELEDNFTLGIFVQNILAGVASFAREGANREKLKHKGLLFRMYVSPNYRGLGLAQKLITAIIERAKKLENMEQIILTVIADNARAIKLYEHLGFVVYGQEPKAIKWKGKYFDEKQMVLFL